MEQRVRRNITTNQLYLYYPHPDHSQGQEFRPLSSHAANGLGECLHQVPEGKDWGKLMIIGADLGR